MAGSYSIKSSVANTTQEPHVKSGGTKLVEENQTQQFETGLLGLKLLVWFALGERASSLGFLIEQVAWVSLGGIASGWSWFGF